jgi:hypothetical protein
MTSGSFPSRELPGLKLLRKGTAMEMAQNERGDSTGDPSAMLETSLPLPGNLYVIFDVSGSDPPLEEG